MTHQSVICKTELNNLSTMALFSKPSELSM